MVEVTRYFLIYLKAILVIKSKLLMYSIIWMLGSIDLSDGIAVVGKIRFDKLGSAGGFLTVWFCAIVAMFYVDFL